jgi:hypothetical protein
MTGVLTQSPDLTPVAFFLGATFALAAGVLIGVALSLSKVSRDDDSTAKRSRHQRDPRGRGPASLDWIPDPPERTRVPRGEMVTWNPRTDRMTPTEAIELPMTETFPAPDYRARRVGGR